MDMLKKKFQDWQKTIAPLQIARKKNICLLAFSSHNRTYLPSSYFRNG